MSIDDVLDTLSDEELAEVPDDELEQIAASAILGAAIMNGSRWADKHHDRCDRVYAECARRRRGIYQRAYNSVVRSQGHSGMASPVREDSP